MLHVSRGYIKLEDTLIVTDASSGPDPTSTDAMHPATALIVVGELRP